MTLGPMVELINGRLKMTGLGPRLPTTSDNDIIHERFETLRNCTFGETVPTF